MNMQVGTSSVVYPAAGFAPMLAMKGVPVAEFNMEETPCTGAFRYTYIKLAFPSIVMKWQ